MKKISILLLSFNFLGAALWAADYIWEGNIDTSWNEPGNWLESGIPAAGYPGENENDDTAEIPNGSVTLNAAVTIGELTITGGSLILADDLTVNGDVNITSGSVDLDSFNLIVTGTLTNGGTLNLRSVNLEAGLFLNNGDLLLAGDQTITAGGLALPAIGGNVEFNGAGSSLAGIEEFLNLTITGNGARTAGAVTVTGNFIHDITDTLSFTSLKMTGTNSEMRAVNIAGPVDVDGTVAAAGGISIDGKLTVNGTLTMGSHDLSINDLVIMGTLSAGLQITVNRSWQRTGTFTANNGNVICNGSVTIEDDNSFNILTCGSGSVINFANGSTQSVTNLYADGSTLQAVLPGIEGNRWIFTGIMHPSNMPVIKDCYSTVELNLSSLIEAADGGNNDRVFGIPVFNWVGAVNSNWNDDGNWIYEHNGFPYTPPANSIITIINIPAGYNHPLVLDLDVTCGVMEINPSAVIDLALSNLTVKDDLINNGTIRLHGNQTITKDSSLLPAIDGTMEFYSGAATLAGISQFMNLIISEGDRTAAADLIVSGNLEIKSSASLDLTASNNALTVDGTLTNGGNLNLLGVNLEYGTLYNNGTIILLGTQTIKTPSGIIGGTVQYQGNTSSSWCFGYSYTNLIIDSAAAMSDAGNLYVDNEATINSAITVDSIEVKGLARLNASITTKNGNHEYYNIILGANVVLDSGTGTGNITIAGNITNLSVRNLEFIAGTGNISVVGNTGSGIALGDITVTSVNNVTFSSSINAGSFTQVNGGGTTVFNGTQNYSAGFSFNGNALTVNNAMNITTGAVNITNLGLFTKNATGNIQANGGFIQTSASTGNSNIASAITTTTNQITFEKDVLITADVTLNSTGKDITFNSNLQIVSTGVTLLTFGGDVFLSTVNASAAGALLIDTLESGSAGDVLVAGAIGSVNPPGNISISAENITLQNSVSSVGKTTIINLQIFAANAPVLSNGGFEQKGGGYNVLGTSSVQANITTSSSDIKFTDDIQMLNDISFNTGTGAGNITIAGNITNNSARNLGFIAGTGNVSVAGNVGSGITLGDITVTSVNNVTFSGSINAGSFTQSSASGSGLTVFNGVQTYSNSFSFNGNDLTVNNTITANGSTGFSFNGNALTVNNAMNITTGAMNVTNLGLFTKSATGNIQANGGFIQASVSTGGSSLAANIVTNNNQITFEKDVLITADVTLNSTGKDITFNSNLQIVSTGVTLLTFGGDVFLSTVNASAAGALLIDTLESGSAGDVLVTGAIGSVNPPGNISISAENITLQNSVSSVGKTTIINLQMFAANAPVLSNGGFEQKGGGCNVLGTSSVQANITTSSSDIKFTDDIQMLNDISFNSGTGAGNIIITGNITNTSAVNIEFIADNGSVSVDGTIGSGMALGIITVTSADDVAFSNSINAESFIQSAGTGVTQFNGAQEYLYNFDFSGVNLTINDSVTTGTFIDIGNSGTFTVGINGGILPGGEMTVTGNTSNNGTIKAGPVASPAVAVDFKGDYAANADGALIGSSTASDIRFSGNVTFGKITHNDNVFIFAGGVSQQLAAAAAAPVDDRLLGDVVVRSGTEVVLHTGDFIRQTGGKKLTLEALSVSPVRSGAVLNVQNGSWHIGGTATAANNFAGINGALILGEGSNLITNHLNLSGDTGKTFVITNTARAHLIIRGNVTVNDAALVDLSNPLFINVVFQMTGNGPGQNQKTQTLNAAQPLSRLYIKPGSLTRLTRDLEINGEVKIEYIDLNVPLSSQGVLDAASFNITLYAGLTGTRDLAGFHNGGDAVNYARWEIINGSYGSNPPPFSTAPKMDNFAFRQDSDKKVSFKRKTGTNNPLYFEIAGNTMWQEFECAGEAAVIQFSRHPDHHTFLHRFSIRGEAGADISKYVTITRLTEERIIDDYRGFPYIYQTGKNWIPPSNAQVGLNGTWALPVYHPPLDLKNSAENEKRKYWNINLLSTTDNNPLAHFEYVRIFFSHAYNQRIPIKVDFMHLEAIPYYSADGTKGSFFNYDWIELRKILYSFTEDSDGDGRLDRIRVQTSLPLNGDFSDFEVKVEGYDVTGYKLVDDNFNNDSFYINLKQNAGIDGGNTPLWSIIRNNSLKDYTEYSVMGEREIDYNIKPFDTIPPRAAYALTLPEHDQTYIKMSEPVVSSSESGIYNSFKASAGIRAVSSINQTAPYTFVWKYFGFLNYETHYTLTIASGYPEFLLDLQDSFKADDLAALNNIAGGSYNDKGYFQMTNMTDQGQRAMDWTDSAVDSEFFMFYIPPKYPLNWGYTGYAKVFGNSHLRGKGLSPHGALDFSADAPDAVTVSGITSINNVFLPPNKLLTPEMIEKISGGGGENVFPGDFNSPNDVIRRVTDVLVSVPPGSKDPQTDSRYFAWPVWARLQSPLNNSAFAGTGNDDFWNNLLTDTGIIWEFDGSKYLEQRDEDIIMQVRQNSNLTGDIELFWTTDVDAKYRNPEQEAVRGRGTGGLWLPGNDITGYYYYYTPLVYDGNKINQMTHNNAESVPPLYIFKFDGIESGNKIEFLLRNANNSDLFIARLDIKSGAAIPGNWYSLVRPFSFDIQDIRRQRGGVTILNNVINSNNREPVYLRYHLARPGRITIQVYTLDGTLVKSLRRNEQRAAGEWTDAWDGTNNAGRPVARGMYFIRIVAPDIDEIRKVMVIR
ncbi:MAG: hypothetical protein FWC22_02410 [Treponema sp.]|nr:hypothetical protein [Treponema sp.]